MLSGGSLYDYTSKSEAKFSSKVKMDQGRGPLMVHIEGKLRNAPTLTKERKSSMSFSLCYFTDGLLIVKDHWGISLRTESDLAPRP